MIWRNTVDRYGIVHKTLHWLIALGVLMMLVMGIVMGDIPSGPDRFWVYSLHKSIGITILALMIARLGWKLANRDLPRPLPTHPRHEQIAAAIVHWGFYILLIAMPLSGWLMTAAANSTVNWFGLFPIPNPIGPDRDVREFMGEAHDIIALCIWGFLGLHVAGALKHVIIDRDGTLRRMLPFTTPVLFALLLPFAAQAGEPTRWSIMRDQSSLTFTATQEGSPFEGKFEIFDGTILFDPERLEESKGNITIDLTSINTDNAERDATVQDADWFDTATIPTAAYTIDHFEKAATQGQYVAVGRLLLRGIERPLDLVFTLDITETETQQVAKATSDTRLRRLDFGVGGGQWADEAMVGDQVSLQIKLTATADKTK